jgi:hypothetical protein
VFGATPPAKSASLRGSKTETMASATASSTSTSNGAGVRGVINYDDDDDDSNNNDVDTLRRVLKRVQHELSESQVRAHRCMQNVSCFAIAPRSCLSQRSQLRCCAVRVRATAHKDK